MLGIATLLRLGPVKFTSLPLRLAFFNLFLPTVVSSAICTLTLAVVSKPFWVFFPDICIKHRRDTGVAVLQSSLNTTSIVYLSYNWYCASSMKMGDISLVLRKTLLSILRLLVWVQNRISLQLQGGLKSEKAIIVRDLHSILQGHWESFRRIVLEKDNAGSIIEAEIKPRRRKSSFERRI